MQQMYVLLLLGLGVLLTPSLADDTNLCDPTSPCGIGCWLPNDQTACQPTGPGYFSVVNSNTRSACPPGASSASSMASSCRFCGPGTYAALTASTYCRYCPPGSFSDIPGSVACKECNATYYNGIGSDYGVMVEEATGWQVYCLAPLYAVGTTAPTATASLPPTRKPTKSPMTTKSDTLPPTIQPSTARTYTSTPSGTSNAPSASTISLEPTMDSTSTSEPSLSTKATDLPSTIKDDKDVPDDNVAKSGAPVVVRRYVPILAAAILVIVVVSVWQRRQRPRHRRPPPPPPPLPCETASVDDTSVVESIDDLYTDEDENARALEAATGLAMGTARRSCMSVMDDATSVAGASVWSVPPAVGEDYKSGLYLSEDEV